MTRQPEIFTRPNPELFADPYRVVSEELPLWAEHNFPGWQDYYVPWMFVGAVEEAGEVLDDWLLTGMIPNPELIRKEAGDIVVYLAALCAGYGWTLQEVLEEEPLPRVSSKEERGFVYPMRTYLMVYRSLGKIGRGMLKNRQGIRGSESEHHASIRRGIRATLAHLDSFLRLMIPDQPSSAQVLAEKWETVRLRDWRQDPHKGGE